MQVWYLNGWTTKTTSLQRCPAVNKKLPTVGYFCINAAVINKSIRETYLLNKFNFAAFFKYVRKVSVSTRLEGITYVEKNILKFLYTEKNFRRIVYTLELYDYISVEYHKSFSEKSCYRVLNEEHYNVTSWRSKECFSDKDVGPLFESKRIMDKLGTKIF